MFAFEEARQRVLERVTPLRERERLASKEALGRILAEDIRAPFDIPALPNSARDGYALHGAHLPSSGSVRLQVVAEIPAGTHYDAAIRAGEAVRIFTGAPLPPGTDTVVMQEHVQHEGDYVHIPADAVKAGDNVRPRGEDVEAGVVLLEHGTLIRPQEMGLLASLGLTHVWVTRRPRVAVLSSGDEVVEAGQPRGPAQIFDSNRYSLIGLLGMLGAEAIDLGIVPDERDQLRKAFLTGSEQADAILTSGGVSVGTYDLVRDILTEVGSIDFWRVKMRPGGPQAYGRIGQAYFFGLPGNPVSAMVVFLEMVQPALWKLMGRKGWEPVRFKAQLRETIRKKPGLMEFQRGIVTYTEGGWKVTTTGPQGSGILRSMVQGNCLILLAEQRGDHEAGEDVWVEPF
ncbi:MAG: molybdopterin molybdotransferase MoeA [Nitrospinae bacterium]|nr:molybdopterin molybdotransferase MoeA [Nitrospinota bacterium]